MQTDPSVLLDILGNENRRKIISLLAGRPCYVSEISGKLGLAPKVVLGHLELLENAGIVESCAENDRRRKYFSITASTHLEIAVSPHTYAVRMTEIPLYEMQNLPGKTDTDGSEDPSPGSSVSAGMTGKTSLISETPAAYGSGKQCLTTGSGAASSSSAISSLSAPYAVSAIPGYEEKIRRLRRICSDLTAIKRKQAELSRLLKQLHMQQEYRMDEFAGIAAEISEDTIEKDILSLLIRNEMSTAYLCHLLGMPPSVVLSGLRRFEDCGLVIKYDKDGERIWKISSGDPEETDTDDETGKAEKQTASISENL